MGNRGRGRQSTHSRSLDGSTAATAHTGCVQQGFSSVVLSLNMPDAEQWILNHAWHIGASVWSLPVRSALFQHCSHAPKRASPSTDRRTLGHRWPARVELEGCTATQQLVQVRPCFDEGTSDSALGCLVAHCRQATWGFAPAAQTKKQGDRWPFTTLMPRQQWVIPLLASCVENCSSLQITGDSAYH
jgi:hypothetical protein